MANNKAKRVKDSAGYVFIYCNQYYYHDFGMCCYTLSIPLSGCPVFLF